MSPTALDVEIDAPRFPVLLVLRLPGEFTYESDQLDRAMERCNREFGDPDKNIGGPKLPPPTK